MLCRDWCCAPRLDEGGGWGGGGAPMFGHSDADTRLYRLVNVCVAGTRGVLLVSVTKLSSP